MVAWHNWHTHPRGRRGWYWNRRSRQRRGTASGEVSRVGIVGEMRLAMHLRLTAPAAEQLKSGKLQPTLASSMLRSRASRWTPGNAPPETACWPRCRGQPGKCAARGQPSHREGDARLKRRLGISRASTLQMPGLPPPAQPALLPQLPSLTHRFHANLFGMSLEPSAVG